MNCDPLSNTGADASLGLLLIIAAACLIAGAVALLKARRRGGRSIATLALLLIAGVVMTITAGTSTPAEAQPADCVTGDNSLTITQTSTLEQLAPGVAPAKITGRVINNSNDETYITAIDVEIASVTTGPESRGGACDASDYVLRHSRMLVGRTLSPGGSASFTGGSIGFNNKATNQDACQHAKVHLLYTANRR